MDDNWLWFAGLFEGEGCIALTGANSVTLTINMTDKDVIERAANMMGVHVTGPRIGDGRNKPLWTAAVTKANKVQNVLDHIQPFLGERRKVRVQEAVDRLANVRKEGFCSRGHKMSGDNLYVSPTGLRQCRECNKIRDAKRPKRPKRAYVPTGKPRGRPRRKTGV